MNINELDIKHLTNDELNYLKKSNDHFAFGSPLIDLFGKDLFPYVVNKGERKKEVRFRIGTSLAGLDRTKRDNTIFISHRNRSGKLFVDNGYYGPKEGGKDYYLVIVVRCEFTNESQYSTHHYPKTIDGFNTDFLDVIAEKVIEVWDNAIENNAKNWG